MKSIKLLEKLKNQNHQQIYELLAE